jgi:hypothetical protein
MKKTLFTFVFMLFCSIVILAADLDGKWKGSINTDMGEISFTMVYKVDGEKVTGSMISEMGDMQITDGKITGNEIEYSFDVQGMKIKHTGKIDGDKINMKSISEFGNNDFVLTRVKE